MVSAEFSKFADIECSTLTASSFRIFYSSAGVSSPPLFLFLVMLPEAHWNSHSRISGSRWLTTPSWISRSLRPCLSSFSVHSCHLFLISYASVKSLLVLSFFVSIFARNIPLVSPIFLKKSLVFPILLFSSISLHCSFKNFLSLLAILYNSAFSWAYLFLSPLLFTFLLSSAVYKGFSDQVLLVKKK